MLADTSSSQLSQIIDMVRSMFNDLMHTARTAAPQDILGQMEALVEARIKPIALATLQQAMNAYQQRPEPKRFACPCGQGNAGNKGDRDASVSCLWGTVRLKRRVYHCPKCKTTLSPGMEQLGLNGHTFSPRVQQAMTMLQAHVPQRQARDLLHLTLGIKASARTVADVAVRWGEWMAQQRAPGGAKSPHAFAGKPLYAGCDGVFVHSRHQWRELKVGCFYNADKSHSAYYASFASSDKFAPQWQRYAEWTGALDGEPVRATGDGSPWVWSVHEEVFPHAEARFLDFWHAAEHVWTYARAYYGEGTSRCARWAEAMCERLKRQGPQPVLACLKRHKPERKHKCKRKQQEAKKALGELRRYIENHVELMDYPGLQAAGIDIGDGPVESACKLVARRLKGGEKRWRTDRAEAIATMRCVWLSGEWPDMPKPCMANRSPEERNRLKPPINHYNLAFAMN